MGYYTQLLFNCVEVPRDKVFLLRDSAREAHADAKCPWNYLLENVYIESTEEQAIDLGLSEVMTKQLKSKFKRRWVSVDDLVLGEEDEVWYTLQWLPCDGPSGKWYKSEGFAGWVAAFCSSGQIYQMSDEDTGGLWGWSFQDGRIRDVELNFKGRWKKATPLGDYGEQRTKDE